MLPETHTRLEGSALLVVRLAWIVLVAITLGLFVISVPARFSQLLTITPTGDNSLMIPAPAEATALAEHGIPIVVYASFFTVVELSFVLVYTVLGLAIFLRRPNEWWTAFMSLTLIAFGVLVPATARVLDTPGSPWSGLVHLVQNIGWVSFAIAFYLFPDGHFVSRISRGVLLIFLAWAAAWFVFPIANTFNWPLWQALLGFFVMFATGMLAQLYRYRFVSTPAQRLQTKWVVLAFGIATLGIVLFLAPQALFPSTREPGWDRVVYHLLGIVVFAASLLGIPISIDIAIRRYRLWEIDPIINRALVYGVLTLMLVVIYLAGVIGLQQVLRTLTSQSSDLAIIVSTLVIAALFNPLRGRVQNGIDRRFYRHKYNAAQVLAAFAQTVRDDVDLESLMDNLLAVVNETMQPVSSSVWLKRVETKVNREK